MYYFVHLYCCGAQWANYDTNQTAFLAQHVKLFTNLFESYITPTNQIYKSYVETMYTAHSKKVTVEVNVSDSIENMQ